MRPWMIGAVLAAVCGIGGALWHQGGRAVRAEAAAARLSVELAATRAELQRQAEAARVHRAWLDRAEAAARRYEAALDDLQKLEGRDAPLDPVLRATVERLRF
ncbi:hypothetical protein [Haematobacter massiliensis]|uniref:hypothetical protein n=1 Tax=Haematobacter massiliensis TaxID=195105 RepID=UPI0023F2EF25|nr:hypothetical protein [Haematobacter massiliensis]